MTKDEFYKIRKRIKKTQKEIAGLLGVSKKAVESYEQGLRNIPSNIERILYFLLFKLNKDKFMVEEFCWDKKECPDTIRANCIAWIAKEGFFCWFITGKVCALEKRSQNPIENCFSCSFFKNNLKNID
ncbi:MAG: helix-turn-helix transcriptional regulator [bacterium]|nr:helix-turn-helix transcriptional regulator [bacterium]